MHLYKLRPSVAYSVGTRSDEGIRRLVLFYGSGTTEVAVDLDSDGYEFFEKLTSSGVRKDDPLSEFFVERDLLLPVETYQQFFERDQLTQRNFLYFDDNPEFPDIGSVADIIQTAKITVVGLGGIGSNLCQALVRLGFADFVLIDPDIVSKSNLNRQSSFVMSDVGRKKVDVLRKALTAVSPDIRVDTSDVTVDALCSVHLNGRLVINCADRPNIYENTKSLFEKDSNIDAIFVGGGYFCSTSFVGPLVERSDLTKIAEKARSGSVFNYLEGTGGNTFFTAVLPATLLANEILKYFVNPESVSVRRRVLSFDWNTYKTELSDPFESL